MKIILMAVVLLTGICSFSQQRLQSTYLELGGPGNATLNYDYRFSQKATGLGSRTGLGWVLLKNDVQHLSGISVPFEINHFIGIKKNLFFELGAGMVYQKIRYNNKLGPIDSASSHLSEYLDLAIRVYLPGKRLFFRAAYMPVLHYPDQIRTGIFAFSRHTRTGISLGLDLGKRYP